VKAVPGQKGRFATYLDSAGVLTIGWGHTNHHLPRFSAGAVWSQAECDAALAGDMMTFERHVRQLCHVDLTQYEFDAFNTGGPATATLWKKMNAGNKKAVPAELAKWNRAGGRALAGLTRRRKAEGLMFAGT
jgi:lysozyme